MNKATVEVTGYKNGFSLDKGDEVKITLESDSATDRFWMKVGDKYCILLKREMLDAIRRVTG